MVKKIQYTAIEDGGTISLVVAISQAVQVMDLAGEIATADRDVDSLLKISDQWLVFGEKLDELLEGHEEEQDEDEKESLKTNFGFHGSAAVLEKLEVDDAGTTE